MGAQLEAIFAEVIQQGVAARVKFAMLTKMSSTQAAVADDSPENVKRFKDALLEM